jgi:hypothetical protein
MGGRGLTDGGRGPIGRRGPIGGMGLMSGGPGRMGGRGP